MGTSMGKKKPVQDEEAARSDAEERDERVSLHRKKGAETAPHSTEGEAELAARQFVLREATTGDTAQETLDDTSDSTSGSRTPTGSARGAQSRRGGRCRQVSASTARSTPSAWFVVTLRRTYSPSACLTLCSYTGSWSACSSVAVGPRDAEPQP
jgi:hypothetical protein